MCVFVRFFIQDLGFSLAHACIVRYFLQLSARERLMCVFVRFFVQGNVHLGQLLLLFSSCHMRYLSYQYPGMPFSSLMSVSK